MAKHESPQTPSVSRRKFLGTSGALLGAAVTAPLYIPASALGRDGRAAPSERIVMGAIGVGGRGTGNLGTFLGQKDVQMVAVCDIEKDSKLYHGGRRAGREPARELVDRHYQKKGHCAAYADFRELLARDDIDAVSICTPDHWHGLISIAAAEAQKDIYCEKPLTNTLAEGRAVVDAVSANGRVLQTGSHERSRGSARHAAELVRNGRIGRVHTVRIQMPCTEDHHLEVRKMPDSLPEEPVPSTLDWDRWLGHTPLASYAAHRCHFWWRFILAHGGGEMTDRGAHVIDLAQLCLGTDETTPVTFRAKGTPGGKLFNTFFDYEFENTYASGVKLIGSAEGKRGLKIEGSDGWIFINVHGCALEASSPEILASKIGDDEIHLGRSIDGAAGHHRNFLDCVKSRAKPFAHAEIGHRSASICHLNNIAMLTGREIRWDPKTETIHGDAEASALLAPKMRAPWKLPARAQTSATAKL